MSDGAICWAWRSRDSLLGRDADTQSMPPHSTPSQVAAHVRKQIEIWRPGGGFVFQQVHNIMANVPPKNIAAMLEAVQEIR